MLDRPGSGAVALSAGSGLPGGFLPSRRVSVPFFVGSRAGSSPALSTLCCASGGADLCGLQQWAPPYHLASVCFGPCKAPVGEWWGSQREVGVLPHLSSLRA